jgi:hypothetical protein
VGQESAQEADWTARAVGELGEGDPVALHVLIGFAFVEKELHVAVVNEEQVLVDKNLGDVIIAEEAQEHNADDGRMHAVQEGRARVAESDHQ